MRNTVSVTISIILANSLLFGCGGSSSGDSSSTSSTETPITTTPSTPTTDAVLRINEIVASAENGNDWIELYAVGGSIDLSSYTIVDDNTEHQPQALPAITLADGEYLVIQAIDEADTPPENTYYVTFKLGADDAVTLYKNNQQVDQLDWHDGDAATGFSYGLYTDGSNNTKTLTPTAGTSNLEISAQETPLTDLITTENAPLRINEIVAADSNNGHDWIELYVTGTTDVNLNEYSLTDENGVAAVLPNVTLAPNEYYRIYATTEILSDAATVSFKLGASDEVRLYKADDLIDQLAWKKGQALAGFSYGRFPDGSDATQVLTPSPVTLNQLAIHGPLVISEVVANDTVTGNDWFELYNNSEQNINLANYQVIDSSDDIEPVSLPNVILAPNDYLVIYAVADEINDHYVPFKLGNADELSLMLNNQTVDYIEWDESDVMAGLSYGLSYGSSDSLKYGASASTSNTDMINGWVRDALTPTQGVANETISAFNPDVVNSLYFNISPANWQAILANPLAEQYHETSITFNNITLDSVAIRTKGGSSLSSVANSTSDRYSFKIDINEYVSGQKFFGLKKFTLQNSFNDPSYMRETIAYNLLNEMGVPTPQHAYVNVYINNELFGLYLMVEAIDGEFIENHFANANGDLYKPDGVGSDLTWLGSNISSYSEINLQSNEDTSDQGAFINFVEKMNQGSTEVIDVDTLLRYMSVSVALSNLDSYHGALAHNYYLYEQDGVFSILPWDFNEAFGSFNMGCNGVDIRELYIDEPTNAALADKPLIANAFANQTNLTTYHNYLWQLINGPLANNTFSAEVNRIANLIRQHVQNDPTAFYGASAFEQNLTTTVSRFYGLTSFMSYRVANMTKQLQGEIPSAGTGSGFCGSAAGGFPARP